MSEDVDERPSRLTDDQVSELATAYVTDLRAGALHPDEWGFRDTSREVWDYLTYGPDPLRLLDAILEQDSGDDEVTEDVGLGWLVGLLDRREVWDDLDARFRKDPRWAAAARYSFTDGHTAAQLPAHLASLVPTFDPDFRRPPPSKQRGGHKRRPSKRQDRHRRHR